MANIITWIKDRKKKNTIIPKTMTKAVYNDDGTALSETLSEVVLLNQATEITSESVVLVNDITKYKHLEIYYQCTGYADIKTIPTEQLAYAYPLTILASVSNYVTATLSIYNGTLSAKYLTGAGALGNITITKIVGTYY